jgi:hypothetical protein
VHFQVADPHVVVAACSGNSACHKAGLAGNCCPADDGTVLGCCPPGSELIGSTNDDDADGHARRRTTMPFLRDGGSSRRH